jgi:DNA-binding transcriptional regulator GbsR (MarR family)
VSRASISTDTRRLVDKGLLVRGSVPGDRRTYYTFAPDGFRTMLAARIRNLSSLRALLDEASALPTARTSAEVRHRLTEWTDFHTAAIDLLQALLTRRTASDTNTPRHPAVA